jgi:hypothetical protein
MFVQESLFNEPYFDNQYTLSQLRQMAEEGAKKCKCCGGNIRVYKRKLNSGMARLLCWFVANRMGDWTHINKIPAEIDRGHEIGRLSYWGLVERQENFDTSNDVLRQRFSYEELMRGGNGIATDENEEWIL